MSLQSSTVYLREVATGNSIQGELWDGISSQHLTDWKDHWQPATVKALLKLIMSGTPMQQWPQSWHWNWEQKTTAISGLLGARTFCVVAAGMTQGLMSVDLTKTARVASDRGKPLVYVDFLEVAPWNRKEIAGSVRFRGTGTVLVTAAVQLSLDEGFKGRIGLHSLPQSDDFYRKTCGMTDLDKDPQKQNLRYFEMTPGQAKTFMGEEGQP